MKILSGSFSTDLRHSAKKGLQYVVRLFQPAAERVEFAVVFALRVTHEQVLPDLQAAGDVGLSAGLDLQPRGQQHHIRIGAEHRPRRSGLVIRPRTAA